MTLKSDAKFKEKLIFCFKNDKNLVNFDMSTRNSQNFHFYWFLLCKVYKSSAKKVERSYLSWHGTEECHKRVAAMKSEINHLNSINKNNQ